MSNNLVSQYPISDRNVGQMEHGSNSMEMPPSEMHRKMGSVMTGNHGSHNLYESTEQRGLVEPLYSNAEFPMVPNNRVEHGKSSGDSMGSDPTLMSDQLIGENASMLNNMAGENAAFPVKRKAGVGPLSNSSVLPNKRAGRIGADIKSLGFSRAAGPQRTTVSAQSKFGFPDLAPQTSPKKKMARNDSMSGRSGLERGQTTKKQTSSLESTSKGRPEPSEAVRSKMRESLTGALALAFESQDKISNTMKIQSDATQASEPNNSTMGLTVSVSNEVYPSKESASLGKTDDAQIFSTALLPDESSGIGGKSFQEFQYSSGLPDEVVPFGDVFFAQDDLLQGHGLSWAFDFDVQMRNTEEVQNDEKPESVKEEDQDHSGRAAIMTPENLAFEIEAELFKLFGEVNKKYREKGRSLLFNLKDHNNPELRERVMSGEISPEKLCSMSAEELASKELSQWRMAKAEEMAQMVVLPDTEVDIRRLVRKTHKGEFQVEVEHDDDGIAADVSGGTSMLVQRQPKKETEPQSPTSSKDKVKIAGQESNSEEHEPSVSVVIPTSGSDLMQGMVVDELKDAEFLPPIVSLDEFMESLNSEPPCSSLSKDAGQKTPISSSSAESPKLPCSSAKDASSRKAGNVKNLEVDVTTPSGGTAKLKFPPSSVPKVEYIWDGVLKLNASSAVTVGGIFQSGERTTTKEWPRTIEMKGRVRLEAFEKFLQELPMSRTRAVMVLQLVLKDKSNTDRANLSEAIEVYSADQRLGYAEPVRGTELYLCPPTSRISDILNKQMPKECPQIDDSIEKNYLIGVVVWRRTTASPNTSHHHKHTSKKQQPVTTPSKGVQDSSNFDTNTTSQALPSVSQKQTEEENGDDDDDDIPPGFGPGTAAQSAKDDDDLPEYNFSGALNPSTPRLSASLSLQYGMHLPQRPMDQMREMIKKYGQSGNSPVNRSGWAGDKNLGFEPWNDENDDDDIPEWNPEPSHPPHNQQFASHRMLPTNQQLAQQSPRGPGQSGRRMQPPHSKRWRHQ